MKIQTIELYQLDLPFAGGVYHLSGGREYRIFDASLFVLLQMMARMAGVKARHLGQPISRPTPAACRLALPKSHQRFLAVTPGTLIV